MRSMTPEMIAQTVARLSHPVHLFAAYFDTGAVRISDAYRDIVFGPVTSIPDETGNEYDGTPSGDLAFDRGYFGTGVRVVGFSGDFTLPPAAGQSTDSLTWQCMFRSKPGLEDPNTGIILYGADTTTNGDGFGGETELHIGMNNNGSASAYVARQFFSPAEPSNFNWSGSTDFNDGKWHFASLEIDNSAGTIELYVDNVQQGATQNFTAGNMDTTSMAVIRGGRPNNPYGGTGDRRFNGWVDDVRLWNTTKSPAVPTAELAGTEPGLLGYYQFNDGPTHTANGHFVGFEDLSQDNEIKLQRVRFQMSGVEDDWVANALQQKYIRRRAALWKGYFDEDSELIAYPTVYFDGTMNQPSIDDDKEARTSTVTVIGTNEFSKWSSPNGRRTNINEQQSFFPTDEGFKFVPSINETIFWGRR